MNFHLTKNCYRWFPMISDHGTIKLLSMGFEILGLGIDCISELITNEGMNLLFFNCFMHNDYSFSVFHQIVKFWNRHVI